MIENLKFIKENGLDRFIEDQEKKWKCQRCGELISCHNGLCFICDFENLRDRKQKYRWDEFLVPK
jgi:ribosomal protein L37E